MKDLSTRRSIDGNSTNSSTVRNNNKMLQDMVQKILMYESKV